MMRKYRYFRIMPALIVNTELYPLDRLDAKVGQAWLSQVRGDLHQQGSCTLPNFVTAEVLQQMAEQARSITHLAYPGPTAVSPYFFNYRLGEGESLPNSHPLRRIGKRRLAQVASDLIPADFLLCKLHGSKLMIDFLSSVLQQPVYQNRDPYQSLNISVMDEGGCQQWHFDAGNMVTTLLLQEPEGGGVFEYVPAIRAETDENFAAVEAVLDGRSDRVIQNRLCAGTLSLFRGHYSLHRVTPVLGKRQRLQAILGYSTNPAMYGKLESSILHYGPRVAEIEASCPLYPNES
jgi:predicted 2-oxoglutarate/Fe(II)-dependent dioxygenase YbiX